MMTHRFRDYVVRQGDYLTRIAALQGFDAKAVWMHAENEALRRRRDNPDVLAPGDILRIPDEPRRGGPRFTSGDTRRYRAEVPVVKVQIRLSGVGTAIEGEPWVVEGASRDPIHGTTDATGVVAFEVPVTVTQCVLFLPARRISYPLAIGHLDPIDTESGVAQRLEHLGYLAPPLRAVLERGPLGAAAHRPSIPEPAEDALPRAIEALQRARQIPVTGVADEATLDALAVAHDGGKKEASW